MRASAHDDRLTDSTPSAFCSTFSVQTLPSFCEYLSSARAQQCAQRGAVASTAQGALSRTSLRLALPLRPWKLRGRTKPSKETSQETDGIEVVPAAPQESKDKKEHSAVSSERALILKTNMLVFPYVLCDLPGLLVLKAVLGLLRKRQCSSLAESAGEWV